MQTIGERLEEARKRKGVSIREAAEATKIRGDYLHKFENNQFDIKLPEIYVRGFLRTYATYLKLPAEKIVSDYKGLGLGEAKSRGLSRESYGRMDLTVSSTAKPGREGSPSASPAPTPTPAAQEQPVAVPAPSDNNPATFRPRAGAAPQIDRALLIKGGIALGGLLVVILLAVVIVRSFGGGAGEKPKAPISTANQVLVQPQIGEPTITIFALDNAAVVMRQLNDGTLLFNGNLSRGESRVVPRRAAIRVEADPYQAIEFEINGRRYPMPGQRTADIEGPRSAPVR